MAAALPALLAVAAALLCPAAALSCMDEEGRPVDWWILYKLPKQGSYRHPVAGALGEGLAYAFLTSALPDLAWTLSDREIGDPLSLAGRTLAPLYSATPDLFHLMYNDEVPHGPTSFNRGHTKGLLLAARDQGLWLIHSVPHYPPFPNETYGYPHTGQRYGQSALCISTPTTTNLETIGRQLQYNNPFIYSTATPPWLAAYPAMVTASKGKHVRKGPFFSIGQLTSANGTEFTSFAKAGPWGKDLYADLVAPSLQTPLLVETWPNGPGKMPSRCDTPFIVENVNEMDFVEFDKDDDFTTRHDHAKWAISLDKKKPYVCIGDINRMDTQRRRAGGTLCFLHQAVWKTFKSAIKEIEDCSNPKLPKKHKAKKSLPWWKYFAKKNGFFGTVSAMLK
jgi:deoxyribonuclease-2